MIVAVVRFHDNSKYPGTPFFYDKETGIYSIDAYMIRYNMDEQMAGRFDEWNRGKSFPDPNAWFLTLPAEDQIKIERIDIETGLVYKIKTASLVKINNQ